MLKWKTIKFELWVLIDLFVHILVDLSAIIQQLNNSDYNYKIDYQCYTNKYQMHEKKYKKSFIVIRNVNFGISRPGSNSYSFS